jgi:hypothetical protein
MTSASQPEPDAVLAAWAPAGRGRIVVILGQGVVIHPVIVSGKAAAVGIMQGLMIGSGVALGVPSLVAGAATSGELYGSPFIAKVLKDGVDGLLASPRITLVRWDEIVSARYRSLMLRRGRLTIRTSDDTYVLKFLSNTYRAGDAPAVFAHLLNARFIAD